MQKKNSIPRNINSWFLLLVFLLFTVIISFKISADAHITQGVQLKTRELAQKNIKIIFYQIELYEKELELLKKDIVFPLDSDENRELLSKQMPTQYFDKVAIYSSDGSPIYSFTDRGQSSDSPTFTNINLANRVFSDHGNVYIMRKIEHEGQMVGSLVGVISKDALSHRTQLIDSNGMSFANMFTSQGEPLIVSGENSTLTLADDSLWDAFRDVEFAQGYSLEKLKLHISKFGTGFVHYKAYNQQSRIAFYAPIGIDDWYIFQVATEKEIDLQSSPIKKVLYETILILFIIFVLLMFLVLYANEHNQKKLRIARKQLEQLTNSIRGGVLKFSSNREGTIEYISNGYLKILGLTHNEYKDRFNQSFYEMVWEEDRERVQKALEPRSLYENRELNLDYRLIGKNGEPVWVIDNLSVILDEDGRFRLYSMIVDATSIKEMENLLRSSNQDLRLITGTHMESRVFEFDPDSGKIHFHEGSFLGYNLKDYDGSTVEDLFAEDWRSADTYLATRKIRDDILSGKDFASGIVRLLKKDTEEFCWVRVMLTRIKENGKTRILGSLRDITEEHEIQLRLSREKEKNRMMIADAIFTGSINLSQNSIIINSDLRGIRKNDGVAYNYIRHLQMNVATLIHPEDVEVYLSEFNIEALFRHYNRGDVTRTVEYRRRASGKEGYIWVRATLKLTKEVSSGDIICFVYINDIDREIRETELLRHKAERDYLTGLYNREGLISRVESYLDEAELNEICAFYSLDLDDFKILNDTFGHSEGDRFLQMIADQLVTMFRKDDLIGRMGGDEFIVFLKRCPNKEFVVRKAGEMLQRISEVKIEHLGYSGSASVGIAISPFDGKSFQDLYVVSDKALYQSKQKGKNICSLYTEEGTLNEATD